MIGSKKRDTAVLDRIESTSKQLAAVSGKLSEAQDRLGLASEYETAQKQLADLRIQLQRQEEDHKRAERETEHKLGLHRKQVESERTIMHKEAEAERIRAVEEAKLAVREGNLDAERKRFEQEIDFRTKRFEQEAETLRDLTKQILDRLPKVNVDRTFSTVEHVGDSRPALNAGE